MTDAPSPTPSRRVFIGALVRGVCWGIAIATAAAAAIGGALSDDPSLRQVVEVAAWTAMIATALSIVPVAPIAGFIGWQLYRRGIVTPVAYAAIGAASALLAPILIVFYGEKTMRYGSTGNYAVIDDDVARLILIGVALTGAFGGFMGGRALRRAST